MTKWIRSDSAQPRQFPDAPPRPLGPRLEGEDKISEAIAQEDLQLRIAELEAKNEKLKAEIEARDSTIRSAEQRYGQVYREAVKARTEAKALRGVAIAASHALRSYLYGNSSTELAESIADAIDAAMLAGKRP